MADNSEVLQSYLIKLGYQIDSVGVKKFEDSLSNTGKKVFTLGAKVATTVTAVAAAYTAFAYNMRKVYFESELAGTSVKNMKSLAYAGELVGISGDTMAASIQNASRAMYQNPGLRAYASALTGINQEGRETSDILADLVRVTAKMPGYQGSQILAMFGMDADTYRLWAAHQEEIKRGALELQEIYKSYGLDLDSQKTKTLEYTHAMDKITATFKILGEAILVDVSPVLLGAGLGLANILSGLEKIAHGGHWGEIRSNFKKFLRGEYDRDSVDKLPTSSGKITTKGYKSTGALMGFRTADEINASIAFQERLHERLSLGDKGKSGTASGAIAQLMNMGWTKEQAIGIAANLKTESGFNPTAVGDKGSAYGIAQWHPDRQADFAKWAGKDIKGSSFEEQMAFLNYELRQGKEQAAGEAVGKSSTAYEAGYLTSSKFERPASGEGSALFRGRMAAKLGEEVGGNLTVTNNNTVTVNGSTDPNGTAKAVGTELDRVNANALRDLKGRHG